MESGRFCQEALREVLAGRASWALGADRGAAVELLAEGAEADLSGRDFAWRLWLAALRAEQNHDPGRAAAARAILRAWQARAAARLALP